MSSEQAVLVYFSYTSRDLSRLHEFEETLHKSLEGKSVGMYDGHDISVDGSDAILYFYGPDAKRLYTDIKPLLRKASFLNKAKAKLRYGGVEDTQAREEIYNISSD